MIDTHCHLTSGALSADPQAVLTRAAAAGVQGAITVSTTAEDAAAGLALAKRFPNVWCTAGMHPLHADEPTNWPLLRVIGSDDRCVAWGELGLDNHYEQPARSIQDTVLAEHLAMIEAAAGDGLSMPVIVHCREAFDDVLASLAASSLDPTRFVFHCFTGTVDEARRVLDFGAWISFTGVVTFQNAPDVAEAARLVPADRIMVETDAPYLSPEPVRKMRPNEPANVAHVARRVADLRGVDPATFADVLDANAARFFGIDVPPPVVT